MTSQLPRRGLLGLAAAATVGGVLPAGVASASPAQSNLANLSRVDRVFLQRGLKLGIWTAMPQWGWAPDATLFRDSGFTDPTFYDPPLWLAPLLDAMPDSPWSATKGPIGEHLTGAEPIPRPILSEAQRARVDDLWCFCFGDEENHSEALIVQLQQLFAQLRTEAPNALLHTNQYAFQWSDEQMKDYMVRCRPDLITFDSYYFSHGTPFANGSVTDAYNITYRTRRLALLGNDLDGAQPLGFGQYAMTFRSADLPWQEGGTYILSESQQRFAIHLTWTLGGKWLDTFRWQKSDVSLLTHADGSPTVQYGRAQHTNAVAKKLSPYLTRLRTQSVGIIPGSSPAGANPVCDLPVWSADLDPATGLRATAVVNVGGANGGLAGDVLIGSFRPIPGLRGQELGAFSARSSAVMVMNALVLPNSDPTSEASTGGSGAETRQRVQLTFGSHCARKRLLRVDQHSGAAVRVPTTIAADGSVLARLDIDGGASELIFWR